MTSGLTQSAGSSSMCAPVAARELFRARFQRALRNCVRRRFSVAECFGVIWLETLEDIRLEEEDQADLYNELIRWAKYDLFPRVLHAHSPALFTAPTGLFQGPPGQPDRGSPG